MMGEVITHPALQQGEYDNTGPRVASGYLCLRLPTRLFLRSDSEADIVIVFSGVGPQVRNPPLAGVPCILCEFTHTLRRVIEACPDIQI
jgi:hypothetical protein